MDWGMEFCKICEIFPGFTPSLVSELTVPQFLLYSEYANDQKRIQLNLENLNDYLNEALGGRKKARGKAKRGSFAEIVECKTDFNNKINSIQNISMAKASLEEKTGRTEFEFAEIIREIAQLDKVKSLKYKLVG